MRPWDKPQDGRKQWSYFVRPRTTWRAARRRPQGAMRRERSPRCARREKPPGIRTSFESVPDAPVTKFVLRMQGGNKGLLANSRNICRSTDKADVDYSPQNGAAYSVRPVIRNS